MTMRLIADAVPRLYKGEQPDLYAEPPRQFASDAEELAHEKALREEGRKKGGAIAAAETRHQRRIAAENRDSARAYGYLLPRARTAAEAEAIEAEYQRRLQDGPDFRKYRAKSGFAPPPILRIDRNDLARLKFLVEAIEHNSWKQRGKGKHGGMLGRMPVQLINAFLFKLYKAGKPIVIAQDKLAIVARMSERALINALDTLERFGFITRHRRLKRIDTPLGPRVVQARNAYEIHPPHGLGAIAARLFGPKFSRPSSTGSSECSKSGVFANEFKRKIDRETLPPPKYPDPGNFGEFWSLYDRLISQN